MTGYWKGKKLSLKTREKMSDAKKGKTPKNIKMLIEAKRNYKYTKKHRKRLSETHKKLGTMPPSRRGTIPWNFRNITPIHERIRKSPEYAEWRWGVFVRDDFTCQMCGVRGARLRANHIKKFSDYPELRLELTNGITICENCDVKKVCHHEIEWESYFNFNLMTRGIIADKEMIYLGDL